jgi:phosphoglycerate-specific signal transduction histidine kinase
MLELQNLLKPFTAFILSKSNAGLGISISDSLLFKPEFEICENDGCE